MKKLLILLITMLLFASCAELDGGFTVGVFEQEPYVWWEGFLHGLFLPISMIARIFNDKWIIYSANNTGVWYDIWFYFGTVSTSTYSYITRKTK